MLHGVFAASADTRRLHVKRVMDVVCLYRPCEIRDALHEERAFSDFATNLHESCGLIIGLID
jgi:hypothetical protein